VGTVDAGAIEAVLFDLDGVLVSTVELHADCWQRTFEPLLRRVGAADASFSWSDYRTYVDGRSRYDGASAFLRSRGVVLPEGDPRDPPGAHSVCALANAKAARYLREIARRGPRVLEGSRIVLEGLLAQGVRLAVVSASRNCRVVLEAAQLTSCFGVRVDGEVALERGLESKPSPALFLEAARQLGVRPARAIVVEDAVAGVQAGRAGGFARIVGVDATGGSGAMLQAAGADPVVGDLREVDWLELGLDPVPWPRHSPHHELHARY
jgi:beta-phosphoglucomutase family hydrolase